MRLRWFVLLTVWVLVGQCVLPTGSIYAEVGLVAKLDSIVKRSQPPLIGVSVINLDSGTSVYSRNEMAPLKPASVLKVLASVVALERLGPNYRFETEFVGRGVTDGRVQELYVIGGGDPNLRIEDIWVIVRKLKRLGIREISEIVLDTSGFTTLVAREGQRAYEAGSSALSFNFNSLFVEVCPTKPGQHAHVGVEPWETGVVLEGKIKTIRGAGRKYGIDELPHSGDSLKGLRYKLRGTIGAAGGCDKVYRSVPNPPLYFGAVFKEQLRYIGIHVTGAVKIGHYSGTGVRLYQHKSKALSLIVEDLNHFSSNYIGEQLLFAIGTRADGKKSRVEGLRHLNAYLQGLGYSSEEFNLEDGSGLSHLNRISARIITHILMEARAREKISVEFEKSLSVSQQNGTLKERTFGSGRVFVRGKTGTLNGVRALAGFMVSKSGSKLAFAIIQNKLNSKNRAQRLEDEMVTALYKLA